MSEVTALIESLMRLEGMSQAELAEKSGLHRSNLCRFLSGETDIRMSSLLSLLSALNVDFTELLRQEHARRASRDPEHGKVESLGGAFETLLAHTDSITAKTLLNTLMVRTQSAGQKKDEVARALKLLTSHSAKLHNERSH
jgi:transcriptional regulator with XRE-family HTH domain